MKIFGGEIIKLSDNIKKYRMDNNLTQQDLANMLYVSKQAISKWENDKSIPDVSLLPVIANLLNISIDELMGNEKEKKPKSLLKKLLIIIIPIIIITISIILIIAFNNKKEEPSNLKEQLISETEKILNVRLGKVIEYDFIDYSHWTNVNNKIYPLQTYYFVFEKEMFKMDNKWVEGYSSDLVSLFPVISKEYLNTCDYFKLVDLNNKQVNEITIETAKEHYYVLYCLQIENKRLICIKFEV